MLKPEAGFPLDTHKPLSGPGAGKQSIPAPNGYFGPSCIGDNKNAVRIVVTLPLT
jgi:hypothetical protein